MLSLYSVLTGDFNQCIKKVNDVFEHLYKPEVEFLICDNIKTDYLISSGEGGTSLIINNNQLPLRGPWEGALYWGTWRGLFARTFERQEKYVWLPFLELEAIKILSLWAVWNFGKGTGLP